MNFEKIEIQDLAKTKNNIDLKHISNTSGEEQQYMKYYNAYRTLFTEYIINKYNLKKYDKKIKDEKLGFKTIEKNRMDVYQYFSHKELQYFYIRNNIYITRLNDEEKLFLDTIINNSNYQFNKESEKFIENTYKKIIYEGNLKKNKGHIIMYGPDSKNFMAPNDALVIGIRYDQFSLNGLTDRKWENTYLKQIDFLIPMLSKMQEELNNNSDIQIKIIQYTDFSIIKRN